MTEIGEGEEIGEEEIERKEEEKKEDTPVAADEVDATKEGKELTDFEVIMEIDLLELVYSHLDGRRGEI